MMVLVACESSGVVRDAFRLLNHDAFSCDILPAEDNSPRHIQADVREVLTPNHCFDLVIAHPPCQYLCSSGLHWNTRLPERGAYTEEAAEFFLFFTRLKCKWAIENPVGCMSSRYRKPDQYVQPYQFGHDASKKTGLWLNDLPLLVPTELVAPRMIDGNPRWSNQTDSGQNNLGPSPDRWKQRSKTYAGIADAMARQWSSKLFGDSL